MAYPPLVLYQTVAEYRKHFEVIYCQGPITTFDGIPIRFRREQFDHSFYESSQRNKIKDAFSRLRAERVDWIKSALQDADADLYQGWDSVGKVYDPSRRVTVVQTNYVVVVQIDQDGSGNPRGRFITAFMADSPNTIMRIRTGPKW